MKISPKEFENSFFYIGPGKDFEPLLRFSHLCTNFFFPNLYMSIEEIQDYAEKYFNEHHEFIEVISCDIKEDFDEINYFELHPSYKYHLQQIQFMGDDHPSYQRAFNPAQVEPQWMLHYTLKRKGVDRMLHLYYFTSEGLAAYVALSHNGQYTPRVFCTIETKVLERGSNIVERLFQQLNSYPLCWIKGFEPDPYFSWDDYKYTRRTYPLKSNEIYTEIGSDFIFQWEAEGSFIKLEHELNKPSRRFCKVFIQKEIVEQIDQMSLPMFSEYGKIMRGSILDIVSNEHHSGERSFAVLTRNLYRFEKQLPPSVHCLYWEDIMRYYDSDDLLGKFADLGDGIENNKYSMLQSLSRLDSYLRDVIKEMRDQVFFIPFGLEDEGVLLADWLSRKKRGSSYIAVLHNPLDCYDLLEVPKQLN